MSYLDVWTPSLSRTIYKVYTQTFVDDDFAGQTWVSNFCNFESFIKTDWGGMIFFSGNTGQPIPEASWSQTLKVYKDII